MWNIELHKNKAGHQVREEGWKIKPKDKGGGVEHYTTEQKADHTVREEWWNIKLHSNKAGQKVREEG